MSKGTLVTLSIVVVLLVGALCFFMWTMGIKRTEVRLRTRFDAQFNVVETSLDNMRKTIMNQHKCTKEWADKFIAVVAEQSEGRPGSFAKSDSPPAGSGLLALGGTGYRESESLGIPQELYLKLANAIEGKLAEFKRSQDVLTDVWRQHQAHCEDPWHEWLIGDKMQPKPEMITSAVAKEAVETKMLDDDLL